MNAIAPLKAVLAAGLIVWGCMTGAWAAETAPAEAAATAAATQAGPGQPPVVVAATSDSVTVSIVIRDQKAAPVAADFSTGLVASEQLPPLVSRPGITALRAVKQPEPDTFRVELDIGGLFAFGDVSVPLLHRGVLVETLRLSRPGLVVKPAVEAGFVAREGAPGGLVLVLDNPAGFGYSNVRARLRFADTDVCAFAVEQFSGAAVTAAPSCERPGDWTEFEVPRYARVTLRAQTPAAWFDDPETGRARIGKKQGVLTLRFQDGPNGAIHEQNLPLAVEFVPSNWSQFKSLAGVGLGLLLGAILSLLLRVSVPNMKRKRLLKDQLAEAGKLISLISTEVDSNLRVLLRVERLALDEIRQDGWPISPDYTDFAQRVELVLPMLRRRIEAVRRLDATLIRRRLMLEQGPSPTRLEQVDERLSSVSEVLKQDSLSDEDWVLVNQRLETAQKIMREPTQTEKEAFEAMLSGRWKAIRKHFVAVGGKDDGVLVVPPVLARMKPCFPIPSLLPNADADPRGDDPDGAQWIKDVGPVRADLQLCALLLVWEFEFLVPATLVPGDASHERWFKAMEELNRLLATPAVSNLREAKVLLRQLAEGVEEADIHQALTTGHAAITMDPALPRPNQKIRFSVRLRPEHLGSAAARDLVACRWTFSDRHAPSGVTWVGRRSPGAELAPAGGATQALSETGWDVHHYFERDVDQSQIRLEFYSAKGERIELAEPAAGDDAPPWHAPLVPVTVSRRSTEKRGRVVLETVQLGAALLVPLATLASTTLSGGGAASWWQLIAIGFASDTIKNILVGTSTAAR